MTDIAANQGIVTQITTVKMNPSNQHEVLRLMQERARFMATQPGFVSVNLHRSKDGSHVVNYVQWTSADKPTSLRRPITRRSSVRSGRGSASWCRTSSPAFTRSC